MSEFEKKIAEVVSNKLNDGTVERIIEQQIEESVEKALGDIFGYSGEGQKLMEKKISEVIVPVIERHDFNKYLTKLDTVLTGIISQTSLADNKRILDNFKDILKEPDRKEIKLSEIFEEYCKYVAENVSTSDLKAMSDGGEPYDENVTANMQVEHVDKGYLYTGRFDDCYVNFSCEEDENLNLQIKLYKSTDEKTWRIISSFDAIEIGSLRNTTSFEILLYSIKNRFTEIILDTEIESDDVEPDEKPEWSLN